MLLMQFTFTLKLVVCERNLIRSVTLSSSPWKKGKKTELQESPWVASKLWNVIISILCNFSLTRLHLSLAVRTTCCYFCSRSAMCSWFFYHSLFRYFLFIESYFCWLLWVTAAIIYSGFRWKRKKRLIYHANFAATFQELFVMIPNPTFFLEIFQVQKNENEKMTRGFACNHAICIYS